MANFGKLGEKMKGVVLASGLAFAPMTAATAQEVQSIVSQNTFTSLQQANRAAQSAGMIVAWAYNGEVRIVSAELASLLDAQGFWLGQDGILYGFEDGAIFEGFNFAQGVDFLENNSKKVKIEAERSDNDKEDVEEPEDPDDGGGCGNPAGCEG